MHLFGRQVSLDIELSAWVNSGPSVGSQRGVLQRKGSHSPKCGSADRGEGKDQCSFYYVIRAQPPKLSL